MIGKLLADEPSSPPSVSTSGPSPPGGIGRAGAHQHFHEHHVLGGQVELGHVQADELDVKAVARRFGMAMAAPSRLSLGGVTSPSARSGPDHDVGPDPTCLNPGNAEK